MRKLLLILLLSFLFSFYSSSQDTTTYGSKFSIGVDIGGGGIVGIPLRVFFTETIVLELGPHLRPVYSFDDDYFGFNFAAVGGPIFYFRKHTSKMIIKRKMHGVFMKAGYSTGSRLNEILTGAGWSYEKYNLRNSNRSFSLELGIGLAFNTDKTEAATGTSDGKSTQPILWFKVAWNFFLGK